LRVSACWPFPWTRPCTDPCTELISSFDGLDCPTHVPYWWVNNPTLGEFCFTMIGRADIEGSKSNVAMNAWLPQASYPCDVPPQPNSPPDNVLRPDRPAEASLGSKRRGCYPASDSRRPPGMHRTPRDVRCSSSRWTLPPAEPFPGFCSDRRALLLIKAWLLPRRPGIGRALQRHPFSGLVDSADERFARQCRCGPPPEFPLASPRSGIVHHLSGPDRHAHTRTLLRRSRSVGCAPVRDPANQLPCALRVYSPVDSHTCQTPWSVPGLGHHLNPRRSTPRIDRRTGLLRSASDQDASPAPIRFPPDNFKHSLTLFSKSFSSLPRGTCSLSVSRPYLALDGIYRPIGAAFPNNPTRRQRLVVRQGPGTTGLSPSLAPLSRELGPGPSLRTLLQTTIRTPKTFDFQAGLFPVRSPLLRESLLVSFPPLIDMLKLSG
ncbi:unnamed protein product, partial [Brassica rapa subsp. trilocularis]